MVAHKVLPPITPAEYALQLDTVERVKHFTLVVPPTEKNYKRVLKDWAAYHTYISQDRATCLQQNEIVPTAGKLKLFMRYILMVSTGLFAPCITVKSLRNKWYQFRAGYLRATSNLIPKEVGADVLAYIHTDLRREGAALLKRKKEMADLLDVQWLLTYLWCYDKYQFRHARQRMQLSFLMLLLVYTGSRAGSIVESSSYCGSNEALSYRDIKLVGLPKAGGGIELVLKIRLRFEKGNREDKDDEDEVRNNKDPRLESARTYKWVTFHEDPSCRGRCPVTHFLGLAFADAVFEAIQDPSDFQYLQIGQQGHSMPFTIKENKKDTLVFRGCMHDGSISQDRAMTYAEVRDQLAALGYRAGLRDRLRTYNIRRGTANAVEGDVTVSAMQYQQLLGHTADTMGAHYISNISGIDAQNLANGQLQRKDHIQQLRRMCLNLNIYAPEDLPHAYNLAILADPELRPLLDTEERLRIKLKLGSQQDDISVETQKMYSQAMSKRKTCYRRLRAHAEAMFRHSFFGASNTADIKRQIEFGKRGTSEGSGLEDSKMAERLQFVSATHFKDQFGIANLMWITPVKENFAMLVDHMVNLCDCVPSVLYYHDEAPISGCCPICSVLMTDIKAKNQAGHIHKCFEGREKAALKSAFDASSPDCCKWDGCGSELLAKVRHLDRDFGKDSTTWNGRKYDRQKEAKRLYDNRRRNNQAQQDQETAPREMMKRRTMREHFFKHFRGETHCLWDNCGADCVTEHGLLRHLSKTHSLYYQASPFDPKFCYIHPECGWFRDEFEWEDHCEIHVSSPISSGLNLRTAYGTIINGSQCPFCLAKENALPSDRFTQIPETFTFNRHLLGHTSKLKQTATPCPVPGCDLATVMNVEVLEIHLSDKHGIKLSNFAKSRGSTKRPQGHEKLDGDEDEIDCVSSDSCHMPTDADDINEAQETGSEAESDQFYDFGEEMLSDEEDLGWDEYNEWEDGEESTLVLEHNAKRKVVEEESLEEGTEPESPVSTDHFDYSGDGEEVEWEGFDDSGGENEEGEHDNFDDDYDETTTMGWDDCTEMLPLGERCRKRKNGSEDSRSDTEAARQRNVKQRR